MLNRLLVVLVFVPLAVVLIALAVANRAPTPFTLDPFNPGNPALTLNLPLFVWLFSALILGLVTGSVITWGRQSRYRRLAREREQEAARLREAARMRPPVVAATPGASVPALSRPTLSRPAA